MEELNHAISATDDWLSLMEWNLHSEIEFGVGPLLDKYYVKGEEIDRVDKFKYLD